MLLLPKGLRLAARKAGMAGLPSASAVSQAGRAEEGSERHTSVSRWPVEMLFLAPHTGLFSLSDLIHVALAWTPFSNPLK